MANNKNNVTRAEALRVTADFIRSNADTWATFAGDIAP